MPDGEGGTPPLSTGAILHKTARGAGWIIGWRMARRLLGVVNTIVLARLLLPADFGLVALGVGLSGSLDALSSLGVEDALVREATVDRSLYDTAFTLNVLRGVGTAAILAGAAWPAARFFGDPRLVSVILVLAVSMALGGAVNIGTADFRRDLDFKKEFILLSIPRFAAFVITLAVAVIWRSYWALLLGILANRLLSTAVSYAMHPYRPSFSLRKWRQLGGFSFWTWAIGVATALRDRAISFVIGRNLGEVEVGVFSVGAEIALLPMSELLAPLGRALFSGFAAGRHGGINPSQSYLRVLLVTTLGGLPLAVGISAVAAPAVRLLLGDQWLSVIPVVQVLGFMSITGATSILSEVLLSAYGRLTLMFRVLLVFSLFRLSLIVLIAPWYGLMGAVYLTCLSASFENVVYTMIVFRVFDISAISFLRGAWRSALATVTMAVVLMVTGAGRVYNATSIAGLSETLLSGALLGVTAYFLALYGLWIIGGRPDGPERDLLKLLKTFNVPFAS